MSVPRWRIGDLVERDAEFNCPAIGVVIAEHSRETFSLFILLPRYQHGGAVVIGANPEARFKRVNVGGNK